MMLAGVAAIAWAGHIFAGATVLGRAARQQAFGPTPIPADVVGRAIWPMAEMLHCRHF
jgi:hypothetical protein